MQEDDSNCDYCQICEQGGKLFCCDECPRAFHGKCLRSGRPTSTTWKCDLCTKDNQTNIVSKRPSRKKLQPLLTKYTNNGTNKKEIRAILKLYDIVKFLMKYDFGHIFSSPVDINMFPTYVDKVDGPMDLGTIAKNITKGIYFDTVVTSTTLLESTTLPELENFNWDVDEVASASMDSEDLSEMTMPEQSKEGVPIAPRYLSRQCELTPTLMKEDVDIASKEPSTGPRTVSKSSFRHIKIETGKGCPGQTIKTGSNLFYIAKEDDKVFEIAERFNVRVEVISELNKRHHPSLGRNSKFKANTMIKLPRTDELAGSNVCIEEKNDLVGLNRAIFSIIKDIELVWHNYFHFNEPNSKVYRMGMVQRKKFLALVNSSLHLDSTVVEKINEYTAWVQQLNKLGDLNSAGLCIRARDTNDFTPTTNSKVNSSVDLDHTVVFDENTAGVQQGNDLGALNSAGRCIQARATNDLTPTTSSKRHKSSRNELDALPFLECCICQERHVEDEDNLMTFPSCDCETKLIESSSSLSDSQENTRIMKYNYRIVHQSCYEQFIEKTQEVFECNYRGSSNANPRCSVTTKCPYCSKKFLPRTLNDWLKSGFGTSTKLKESIKRTIRIKNRSEGEPDDDPRRQEYLPGELQRELQEKEICFRQQQEEDRQQQEDRRALHQTKEGQSAETLQNVDDERSLRFSSTDQQCFDEAEIENSTNTSRKEARDVIDLTTEGSDEKADKMSTTQEVIDLTNDDIPSSVQFHCQPEHQEESPVQINESSSRNVKPKGSSLSKDETEVEFMRSLSSDVTKRFLELGFAKYDEQWNPVIFLSPFDIARSELRVESIAEYLASRGSKPLRHLVYWYGEKIFSLVNETDTVSDLEGIGKEYNRDPIDLHRKNRERKELTAEEQRRLNGLESFAKALRTPKHYRWNRILNEPM